MCTTLSSQVLVETHIYLAGLAAAKIQMTAQPFCILKMEVILADYYLGSWPEGPVGAEITWLHLPGGSTMG